MGGLHVAIEASMEMALYRGMRYDAQAGLLLVVQIEEGQLIAVPFAEGTLEVEKRITALGGSLILIRAGFQEPDDESAILGALMELVSAIGGDVYR
jgi:hypothetical protein